MHFEPAVNTKREMTINLQKCFWQKYLSESAGNFTVVGKTSRSIISWKLFVLRWWLTSDSTWSSDLCIYSRCSSSSNSSILSRLFVILRKIIILIFRANFHEENTKTSKITQIASMLRHQILYARETASWPRSGPTLSTRVVTILDILRYATHCHPLHPSQNDKKLNVFCVWRCLTATFEKNIMRNITAMWWDDEITYINIFHWKINKLLQIHLR